MKTFKDINRKETDLEEACWVGYKKVGMKKKGDRMVPNCVKEEIVNEVYGKDFVYSENVGDMYKGKLSDTQITNLKNLWKTKKQSDVTPSVKSYVRGLDQFTKMDIKKANIKYLSNLIDSVQEEVDFVSPLQDQIEIVEMNSVVRKTELKEFSTSQIERLAKAYNVMKDRTISLANAKKLGAMMDKVPVSSLNDLRKKRIPFISGLAMTRMIKLKMPITETYTVQITKKDGSKMMLGRYNTPAEAQRYVDQYGAGAKIVKEDLNSDDKKTIEPIIKQLQKSVKSHDKQAKQLKKDIADEKNLEEGKYTIGYEIESDSRADDKYVGEDEITINASSSKDAAKKFGERMNKLVKQAGQRSKSILKINMTSFEDDNRGYNDSEINKLDDQANDIIYKNIRNSYTEADLSKSQITKVHKQADDLPKKDFMKRYGKDGDAVRYATATNMVKKKLGIGEDNKLINKGELKMNESYKLKLNSAMEHYKIDSLAELKDEDQKAFFSYVDSLEEGLSAGQKKLPPALQKAILAKQGKKDDKKEMHDMKKKEMKEEDAYDGTPAEVAKMKAKEKADAEKAKAKSKNEMMSGNMNAMKKPMNAMAMQAMKMPIRAMKKMEDLVGGQKKLDKDKDGDLDAKDFAALRKTKSEAVKTGEADAEPKTKELNAMIKDPHKSMADKPMKDMNATYMKSNVKAPVMNNGGSDMAKVKDKPEMMNAMMKISKDKKMNAMYGESNRPHRYLETKPGSLEEAVLKARGLVK